MPFPVFVVWGEFAGFSAGLCTDALFVDDGVFLASRVDGPGVTVFEVDFGTFSLEARSGVFGWALILLGSSDFAPGVGLDRLGVASPTLSSCPMDFPGDAWKGEPFSTEPNPSSLSLAAAPAEAVLSVLGSPLKRSAGASSTPVVVLSGLADGTSIEGVPS